MHQIAYGSYYLCLWINDVISLPTLECVVTFIFNFNHLFYIDSYHKLVRWRLITHCSVCEQ